MPEEKKPTLDERLEALVHSLELAEIERKELDARERKGREALLAGIARYLQVLGGDDK